MADGAFLDTGGLLAALNKDDDLHESATAVLRRLEESGRQVVTTNFVLAEVGNGLADRASTRHGLADSKAPLRPPIHRRVH